MIHEFAVRMSSLYFQFNYTHCEIRHLFPFHPCILHYCILYNSRWCMRTGVVKLQQFFFAKLNDLESGRDTTDLLTFECFDHRKVLFMPLLSRVSLLTLLSVSTRVRVLNLETHHVMRIPLLFQTVIVRVWWHETDGETGKEFFFVHWLKREREREREWDDVSCGSWVPTGT